MSKNHWAKLTLPNPGRVVSSWHNPIHWAQQRAGPKMREARTYENETIISGDVIKLAQTESAAPIVFARMKNGSIQFCVQSHEQNAVTKLDGCKISRIDECISSLGKVAVFSTLDTDSRYWKIKIKKKDQKKTEFTLNYLLSHFVPISFGFRDALKTFQRTVDVAHSADLWQPVLVYSNDNFVLSSSAARHRPCETLINPF